MIYFYLFYEHIIFFLGKIADLSDLVAISIIRAGDSLLQNFLQKIPEAKVGKILIQRNEKTSLPILFYTKLPVISEFCTIFLLDPMLATGGSAVCAVKEILEKTHVKKIIKILCPNKLSQNLEKSK